jgi:hypothetical protein
MLVLELRQGLLGGTRHSKMHVIHDFHVRVCIIYRIFQPSQLLLFGVEIIFVVALHAIDFITLTLNELHSRLVAFEVTQHSRHHGLAALGSDFFAGQE